MQRHAARAGHGPRRTADHGGQADTCAIVCYGTQGTNIPYVRYIEALHSLRLDYGAGVLEVEGRRGVGVQYAVGILIGWGV
jgi:hypothetical protein